MNSFGAEEEDSTKDRIVFQRESLEAVPSFERYRSY